MKKLKTISNLFSREDLLSIKGTKTELGCTTNRRNFTRSDENKCLEWLREDSRNGLTFIFDNDQNEIIRIDSGLNL